MKHKIIVPMIILLFLPICYSSVSETITDYYYDSGTGYYITDGLNSDDITLNNTYAYDGLLTQDAGWNPYSTRTNYTDTINFKGSVSIVIPQGVYIRYDFTNNESFRGIVRSSSYIPTDTGDGFIVYLYLHSGHYVYFTSNGATWKTRYYNGVSENTQNWGSPIKDSWFNWSYDFTVTDHIAILINDQLGYNYTLTADSDRALDEIQIRNVALDLGDEHYIDNFMVSNNQLPEGGVSDVTPPIITIGYPSNNSIMNYDVWINISIDEDGTCSLNNSAFNLESSNSTAFNFFESSLIDGNYNILIECNDTSLNTAYALISFTKAVPYVNITYPYDQSIYRDYPLNVTFQFYSFNATNCTLYTNYSGIYHQEDSIQIGTINQTICYNETTYYGIPANITSNDTEGSYRMENDLNDSSINDIDGKGVGSYSFSGSKGGNGTGNYSLLLSGGYINLSDNFDYPHTQAFSITAWVKTTTTGAIQTIFSKRKNSGQYEGYMFYLDSTRHLAFAIDGNGGTSDLSYLHTTTATLTQNIWYYVTVTYSGSGDVSGMKLYINTIEHNLTVDSDSYANSMLNDLDAEIGSQDHGAYAFTGYIDELLIFDSVLDIGNISYLYNNGISNLGQTSNTTEICNSTLINQTLNQSIDYILQHEGHEEEHEDLYLNITCYDDTFIKSDSIEVYYDNDFTPPEINLSFPSLTYNDTYSFNIWVNLTTDENSYCWLNNTAFSLVYNPIDTIFGFYEDTLINDFYSLILSCNDTAIYPNQNNLNLYFTKDKQFPLINTIYPNEDNTTELDNLGSMIIISNFTENNDLYGYDVNITYQHIFLGEQLVYEDYGNLSGLNYLYYNELDTSTFPNRTLTMNIEVCDSHTNNELKDKAKSIIKIGDEIIFYFGKKNIKIKSLQKTKKIKHDLKKDRYTFEFDYDSDYNTKTYELRSSGIINYLGDLEYKGHFVICDDNKRNSNCRWVDFEQDYNVIVEKGFEEVGEELKEYYTIIVNNPNRDIAFNSIGELNCITETYLFKLNSEDKGLSAFGFKIDLNSIGSVLLLFCLFVLYLGSMTIGLFFKNMGFVSLGFFTGLILGFLLIPLSFFFGIMILLIDIVIFIGIAKKG